jgi:hypothetical protein
MRQSEETVNMVVAVVDDELVGSTDDMFRGRRLETWSHLAGEPLDLYRLREVPLSIAERLIDHPRPGGAGFRTDRMAWSVAKQFAGDRPFYEG